MQLKFKTLVLIIFILNNYSCNSKKDLNENKSVFKELEKNQIVFLIFKINKNLDSNNNKIELIKTIKTDGVLKKDFETETNEDNFLTIELYNDNKIEKEIKIDHPLFKEIESFDDNNKIIKKSVVLDSAEFTIRLQIKNSNSNFRILESLKNKSIKELFTSKI